MTILVNPRVARVFVASELDCWVHVVERMIPFMGCGEAARGAFGCWAQRQDPEVACGSPNSTSSKRNQTFKKIDMCSGLSVYFLLLRDLYIMVNQNPRVIGFWHFKIKQL